MRRNTVVGGIASLLVLTLVGPAAADSGSGGRSGAPSLTVRPGQSIQAAIDAAKPGATIVIKSGTYTEQLLVKTPGLRINGKGARLVAPAVLQPNGCTDVTRVGPPDAAVSTEAGICVLGPVSFGDFDPVLNHRPATLTGPALSGVSISGLTVSGFGTGVIIAGANQTTVEEVRILNAPAYGILAATSPRTTYEENVVRNDPGAIAAIGLCVEASDYSVLKENEVSGYVNGLCLSSSHVKARENQLHNNHFGIYIDPGITDIELRENTIVDNTLVDGAPIPTGIGVFVERATNVRITGNTIRRNAGDNSAFGGLGGGGVVIVDHFDPTSGIVSGNISVTGNRFRDNGNGTTSADIWSVSTGSGFVFNGNRNPNCVSNIRGTIGSC